MFSVRTIHPEQRRVESATYDLIPTLEQGVTVCNLFAEFLAGQPAEFRQPIPFLNKNEIEMQWAAAEHGAAFVAFFQGNQTLAAGVLLSGEDPSSDASMAEALRVSIVEPITGAPELANPGDNRPAMVMVMFEGQPELAPTVQLLATALASVFFRTVRALAASA
ncbi:MAG: hypothetical protein R2762_16790 [Bryobacteraceae bacterium]